MPLRRTPGPVSRRPPSVQEEPRLRILHDPCQALFEVLPGHGAAPKDVPAMCSNLVELQTLLGVNKDEPEAAATEKEA